ncbi:UNKNOWN [Stylonychia lemnae]|uniref:Uncharacterized protein n=1 Tax=Stylonychia lemnae TaxID=5949 RepID=A0A078AJZ2_STYLE|nr:UNKNOWN [Stylonychia lemnae]|eukprot:CDW81123.1 UNKNOWN [Stylonychia lemnae]
MSVKLIQLQFIDIAQQLEIQLQGQFDQKQDEEQVIFDYVDPSSGVLMNQDNRNQLYYEMLGIDHFLKDYKQVQIGMCKVVDHPIYGLDAYPATIFTNADENLLIDKLNSIIKQFDFQ